MLSGGTFNDLLKKNTSCSKERSNNNYLLFFLLPLRADLSLQ